MPTIEVSQSTKRRFDTLKKKTEALDNRVMDDNLFMIRVLYRAEKELKFNKTNK